MARHPIGAITPAFLGSPTWGQHQKGLHNPCLSGSQSEGDRSGDRAGENLYGHYFAGGNLVGGGGFATLGIPKAPECLTHTLMCRPVLHFRAERFANQMATESSINSQHLKDSVGQALAKTVDPQNAVPLASSLHCRHP